jgi:hypothetical protein
VRSRDVSLVLRTVFFPPKRPGVRKRTRLTSFSPTRTCTVLPFGTTCATSLNLTLDWLFLSGCTRKFSSNSGLNLPPARNFDKSSFRRSTAAAISASRAEKSDGSSAGAASFWEAAWDLDSSRAALPPFLRRGGVVEKGRRAGRVHCWLVVRVAEVYLGEGVSWEVVLLDMGNWCRGT